MLHILFAYIKKWCMKAFICPFFYLYLEVRSCFSEGENVNEAFWAAISRKDYPLILLKLNFWAICWPWIETCVEAVHISWFVNVSFAFKLESVKGSQNLELCIFVIMIVQSRCAIEIHGCKWGSEHRRAISRGRVSILMPCVYEIIVQKSSVPSNPWIYSGNTYQSQ